MKTSVIEVRATHKNLGRQGTCFRDRVYGRGHKELENSVQHSAGISTATTESGASTCEVE